MRTAERRLTKLEGESGMDRPEVKIVVYGPYDPARREGEYDPSDRAIVPGSGREIIRRDYATDAAFIAAAQREADRVWNEGAHYARKR